MIYEVFAHDVVFFEQSINTNIKPVLVDQFLLLTSLPDTNIKVQRLQSTLHLIHLPTIVRDFNVATSNALTFIQSTLPRVTNVNVFHSLPIMHNYVKHDKFPLVKSQLVLQQSITIFKCHGIYSNLGLTQQIELEVTKNLSIQSQLNIDSNVVSFIPSKYWYSYVVNL